MNTKDRLERFLPKKKEPKEKQAKMYQPPGNGMRKIAIGLLWTWFGLVTLFLWLLFSNVPNVKGEVEALLAEQTENIAATTAGTEFAKKFTAAYFDWEPTTEGWERRKAELAPMLAQGIDEQAGIIMDQQEWSSKVLKARVAEVVTTGEQEALITLEVKQQLNKIVDNENTKETATFFFTVPVAYENGFGIYQLPSFTSIEPAMTLKKKAPTGGLVEDGVEANIENFLPTFFQSYTTDTPDKLAYFLEDEIAVKGLEGAMIFEDVEEIEVYATETENIYKVVTDIALRDPATNSGYIAHYNLLVKEENGRYIVTKMNEGAE